MLPDLPTASNLFAGLGAWSSPLFDQFLPWIYFSLGITVGVGTVYFILTHIGSILHFFNKNNLPGHIGYDPRKGSYNSYNQTGMRNKSGGLNLIE